MKLSKVIVGISAFAMAAAFSVGTEAVKADAETFNYSGSVGNKITIDYPNQALKLNNLPDTKIFVSFPTVKDKKVGADKNLCTYDVENKAVNVDLSTLNVTKDNYIKVWGNKDIAPILVKIPAAPLLGKGTITTTDDTSTLTVAKKGESNGVTYALDYAVGNGSFITQRASNIKATSIDVKNYEQLGATIRVRVAASEAVSDLGNPTEYQVGKSTTEKIGVYDSVKGTLASKEIKVKIPKMPNAPKVKFDYIKCTMTLPKNAQYRINDDAGLGAWTDGDKAVLELKGDKKVSGIDIARQSGDIDVRTKGTSTKLASKFLACPLGKLPILLPAVKPSKSDESLKVNDKADVTFTVTNEDQQLTISYERKAAVGKTATSGAITIDNKNETYAFQYILVKGTSNELPSDDAKGVKNIKVKTSSVIKLKNKDDYTLYVRRVARVKRQIEWATPWVKVFKLNKTQLDVASNQ